MAGYVLYNLNAGHHTTLEEMKRSGDEIGPIAEYIDITKITNYKAFFRGLSKDDFVVICGGDGTLNRFANDTATIEYPCELYYYPCGTGNDFAADLGYPAKCKPFLVTKYLQNLPCVTVNGNEYRFINGVGYGIDGYCCEVGDKMKAESKKEVNYTSIAIKGLLFHYDPTDAVVTVNGVPHKYKNVWLAPTMNGRFYGGGMMPTPDQNRSSEKPTLSVMVFHGSGVLKTLMAFPSIFKGEHIKHTKMVEILTGHEITVEFDRPTALQIDGETILNVSSYTAISSARAKELHQTMPPVFA